MAHDPTRPTKVHQSHVRRLAGGAARTRFVRFLVPLLLLASLAACGTAASPSIAGPVEPGERIGHFLVFRGEQDADVLYPFDLSRNCASRGGEEVYSCTVEVGQSINVATGIYDDTAPAPSIATDKLEQDWSAYEYELTIDDRPVDLQAFGYVDVFHPIRGVIRFWNVVVTSETAGELSVHDSGVAHGQPFESTTTYRVTAP